MPTFNAVPKGFQWLGVALPAQLVKPGYYLRPTLFVNCDCLDERTSLFLRALKILLLYCPARLCCFRPLNAIVDGCSKVKVKGRTRS